MALVIAKLASALIEGDDNLITKIIEKKFEDLGEEALMGLLGPVVGPALRVGQAIETGGGSEFDRARREWLAKLTLPRLPGLPGKLLQKLQDRMDAAHSHHRRVIPHSEEWLRSGHWRSAWKRADWAQSRDEWLNQKWRHDWRSQPRDPITGEWLPGRLDYIAPQLRYAGVKPGRTVRTFRKKRRARRLAARKLARRLMQGE